MMSCPRTNIARRPHDNLSSNKYRPEAALPFIMFNVPYNINTSIKVMIPYIYSIHLFIYF